MGVSTRAEPLLNEEAFSDVGDFCSAPTGHGVIAVQGVTDVEPLQGSGCTSHR